MARRQTFDSERNRGEHTDSCIDVVLCSVCRYHRRRSRPRCQSQRGEIYEPHQLVYFQPIAVESHGAFRSSGLSFVTSYHFGKTLDRHFWRLARDTSLVSKTVDHHATIQYRFKISHEGFVSADEIRPFRYSNF